MNAATAPRVTVLGVGNVLRRDDAVGVRVVERLRALAADRESGVPEGTRLVDGGTLGLGLLDVVERAGALILVDAVDLGQPAGAVAVLRGPAILAAGMAGEGSAGDGVPELLSMARLRGSLPSDVTLVGVQVVDTGFGEALSACVDAALPTAVDTVCDELRRLTPPPSAVCRGTIAEGAMA